MPVVSENMGSKTEYMDVNRLAGIFSMFCQTNHVYGRIYDRSGVLLREAIPIGGMAEFIDRRMPEEQAKVLGILTRKIYSMAAVSSRTFWSRL